MSFGLLAMVSAHEGRFVDAAWLIVWAVLLDRVDGMVARTLGATSSFGVQMDSLADSLNFGVAPAFLTYVSLTRVTEIGFHEGVPRLCLMLSCLVWVFAGVFRLAKFNVIAEQTPQPVFFGVATTLAAGTLVTWYLVLHRYSPSGASLGFPEAFWGPKLFGAWVIQPRAWVSIPIGMLVGGVLMASNLPLPKLAKTRYPGFNIILFAGVVVGITCGLARVMPDLMALMPSIWLVASLLWGQISPAAANLRAPSFLPTEPSGPT